MSEISLSKAVRSNLLSLQNTANLMGKTQERLSTGNRVNSALDNPTNFFTAASLNARAGDLNNLMDSMSNGIKTIEEADNGIKAITKLVESAQSTIRQALGDAATKTKPQLNASLATATESDATGKSVRETALDKTIAGTATASTAGADGIAGLMGAITTGNTGQVYIGVGDTGHTFEVTEDTTVREFVASINASGLATASVDDAGKLLITANDSKTLRLEAVVDDSATTPAFAAMNVNTGNDGTTALTDAGVASTGVSSEVRTKLVSQFNEIRDQIGKLAQDASFNGINLLNGDKLKVAFNEKSGDAAASLNISGTKLDAESLGILAGGSAAAEIDFQSDGDLENAADGLGKALVSLRSIASNLGSNLSIVQTRQDFTKATINTLQTGAANLTLADMNEEAANMLALQTRQQLSSSALSMASQADQAVLRLF
ncbi:flagellin [Pelagibacterium sp. 26DY04]|uniref:flagellin N-terminal helical domain-containing protein n=1 Tax=Pelagibacterium sp. 26DY04 TaxID=2967130 RepID=UPI00281676A0|nr:flagellin [Pelagibacterium sp. 26DY04]WMT87035.1 flagellin [Pelagibacterium sp. 26DY04]